METTPTRSFEYSASTNNGTLQLQYATPMKKQVQFSAMRADAQPFMASGPNMPSQYMESVPAQMSPSNAGQNGCMLNPGCMQNMTMNSMPMTPVQMGSVASDIPTPPHRSMPPSPIPVRAQRGGMMSQKCHLTFVGASQTMRPQMSSPAQMSPPQMTPQSRMQSPTMMLSPMRCPMEPSYAYCDAPQSPYPFAPSNASEAPPSPYPFAPNNSPVEAPGYPFAPNNSPVEAPPSPFPFGTQSGHWPTGPANMNFQACQDSQQFCNNPPHFQDSQQFCNNPPHFPSIDVAGNFIRPADNGQQFCQMQDNFNQQRADNGQGFCQPQSAEQQFCHADDGQAFTNNSFCQADNGNGQNFIPAQDDGQTYTTTTTTTTTHQTYVQGGMAQPLQNEMQNSES